MTDTRHPIGSGATYEGSGVSIAAGEAAVDLMKPFTSRTKRPEVVGGIGGFASLFRLPLHRYREPLLASSTDGVGTKVAIAQAMDVHNTIGIDLVAMVVDDLVASGAEPLFLQDYIACGKLEPQRIASIVSGIADGCVLAGCALVGGETAEHPGLMDPNDYDLAATGVGVVEADEVLGPDRIRAGDVVLGLGSSGLHSNGYSMVRHVLLDIARLPLDGHVEEFGRTLGEELLEPCRIYALDCLAVMRETDVHAYAHITGGGLANNLARVIPDGLTGAGQVAASYFEWVQGLQQFLWTSREVYAQLDRLAADAARQALQIADARRLSLRAGVLVLAVGRVVEAIVARGIYP